MILIFLCSLRTIADKEIAGFGFGRCKPKSGSVKVALTNLFGLSEMILMFLCSLRTIADSGKKDWSVINNEF